MNRKILVLAVALMATAMLATAVMAAPATKIEGVTVTSEVTQAYDPGYPRDVGDGSVRLANGTSTGNVTVNIPGQDPLVGVWDGKFVNNAMISDDPADSEALITAALVWTFTEGTFEGVIQRTITGYPPSNSSIFMDHLILYGTGNFSGQILSLSYEGTPPVTEEGYLIIP